MNDAVPRIEYVEARRVRALFATPRSPGIVLATQALAGIVDEGTVAGFMTSYTRDLLHNT